MIHYSLMCDGDHRFDGWFRNAATFDDQNQRGLVTCPTCGSSTVNKALMAPSLSKSAAAEAPPPASQAERARFQDLLRALRQKVIAEADYVGDKFAEEARRIHFNEAESRGIYGEATRDEVVALVEDGIDILPLPNLPEERN